MRLRTEDNKLLGVARPMGFVEQPLALAALAQGESTVEAQVRLNVVLALSPKQLDYLEDRRARHRKGDVVLFCDVEAQLLVSKTVNAYLHVSESGSQSGGSGRVPEGHSTGLIQGPVYYKEHTTRDPFASKLMNMWVLSGDNGRAFLEVDTLRHQESVTIRASDWIHDYAGPWHNARYLVIELPQSESLAPPVTPEIAERLNAAIEAAKRAAENIGRGDWNDVIEDLRQVWELLRNHAELTQLLARDGYTSDAITALNGSIQQQFDLASKFMHRTDRSGRRINPEIRASKEDALLCYAFAMALLNLLTRKAMRLGE